MSKTGLEDIILDGVDFDGNKPAKLIIEKDRPPRMEYDLHNWDFQGGLGYKGKNKTEDRRIEALKKCITLQRGHPFLFFLTLNVRHQLEEEPSNYLLGVAQEIGIDKFQDLLRWYSERGSADQTDRYRSKALVPLLVRQLAQINSFDCFCYPPVYYKGPREHLLHFVFLLNPGGTMLPFFSNQKITDVIELPLLIVKDGKFELTELQHPYFDQDQALKLLAKHNLPLPA